MRVEQQIRVLNALARWRPLMAWGGSAGVLGVAASIYLVGARQVDWPLACMAVLGVILLQFAAHPLNDISDVEVDRATDIKGTGREKVLVAGMASIRDLSKITLVMFAVVVGLLAFVAASRPYALPLAAIGFLSVTAYSLPPFRLAYRPFAEFIVVFPAHVAMVVGIVYVATNQFPLLAVVAGVIHGLGGMTFYGASRSMDVTADARFGKNTTRVLYPSIPWCTIMGVAGETLALAVTLFYSHLFLDSVVVFSAISVMGFLADSCRGERAHIEVAKRRKQLATMQIINAIMLSATMIAARGWP
jgi:1,4-dihydroxy-2-naphthoate octaprenyltransferase